MLREQRNNRMRQISKIVVHHTASPQKTTTWEMVDKWHKDKGWSGIGYHYLILGDGLITKGREESRIGAHLQGQNKYSIGICLAGNFETEQPTPNQLISLETLVLDLLERFPNAELTWHRREAATLCPGKNLVPHVQAIKDKTHR